MRKKNYVTLGIRRLGLNFLPIYMSQVDQNLSKYVNVLTWQ